MKQYEMPEIEIVTIKTDDVITTSSLFDGGQAGSDVGGGGNILD